MDRKEDIIAYNNLMGKFKKDCNGCSNVKCKEMHESVINQWYHKLYDALHESEQGENMKEINVDIKLHSPHVTMQREGDLTDLNYCGLNKVFKGDVCLLNGILTYSKGDIFRVSLGFAMKMPEGKMAKVYPRSGTRKNFNVLLTNNVGNIDNDYQGNDDIWMAEFIALNNGKMELGDRILQFEIVDITPKIMYNVVESLDSENRGGYGSTGVR